MATLVLIEAEPEPGQTQNLVDFFKRNLHHPQAHDGFREAAVYAADDDATVIVTQLWDSKAQFEAYLAWRETAGSFEEFEALAKAEPAIRYLEAR